MFSRIVGIDGGRGDRWEYPVIPRLILTEFSSFLLNHRTVVVSTRTGGLSERMETTLC